MALANEIRNLSLRVAAIELAQQRQADNKAGAPSRRNRKAEGRLADWLVDAFDEQELIDLAYEDKATSFL